MKSWILTFIAVAATALAASAPAPSQTPASATEPGFFFGKVVPLGDWFKKQGIDLDADAGTQGFALETDDGKLLPLVKNTESRMFFKDARLLNRPMRLTGKIVPGSSMLQVTKVHSVKEGQFHWVYYWCDHCSLGALEPGPCRCCGTPVELIEELVK